MKKLLSILGSLSMVATAGMAVVACSNEDNANNPSHSWNEFKGWIDDSKTKKDSEIVFVGGRKDIGSLSFLAAKKQIVDGSVDYKDIDGLTNQSSIDNIDKKLWSKMESSNSGLGSLNVADAAIQLAFSDSGSSNDVVQGFWNVPSDSNSNDNNDLKYYSKTMTMHTILVDDLASFFSNGVGKKFGQDYIKEQVEYWVDFYLKNISTASTSKEWTPKEKKNAIQRRTNSIFKSLKESASKGPFFLIFNNGKLSGISSGFKHYYQFDESESAESSKLSSTQAVTDFNNLFSKSFRSNIWKNIYSLITNAFYPQPLDDSKDPTVNDLIVKNSSLFTDMDDWKTSGDNKTYNSKNIPNDSETTFAIDPTKYID